MTSLIGWGSSGDGIFENIIGPRFPAVDARQLYVTATSQSTANSYRNFFLENQTLIYGPTICVNISFFWAFARCPNLEYGPTILAPNLGLTGSWILCPKLKYIKCMTNNQIALPWDQFASSGTLVKKRGVNWTNIPSGWTVIEED